jgi:hypothetical protein
VDRPIEGMTDLSRRTVAPTLAGRVITDPETWNALVDPNQLENDLLNLSVDTMDVMPDELGQCLSF